MDVASWSWPLISVPDSEDDVSVALGPVSLTATQSVVDAVTEPVIQGWMDAKWLSMLIKIVNATN